MKLNMFLSTAAALLSISAFVTPAAAGCLSGNCPGTANGPSPNPRAPTITTIIADVDAASGGAGLSAGVVDADLGIVETGVEKRGFSDVLAGISGDVDACPGGCGDADAWIHGRAGERVVAWGSGRGISGGSGTQTSLTQFENATRATAGMAGQLGVLRTRVPQR